MTAKRTRFRTSKNAALCTEESSTALLHLQREAGTRMKPLPSAFGFVSSSSFAFEFATMRCDKTLGISLSESIHERQQHNIQIITSTR